MNYTIVSSPSDVRQILELQAINHVSRLDVEQMRREGFVTVRHDEQVLTKMNEAYPSVIAKDGEQLAGYCLVMLREFAGQIPVLAPMFDQIALLEWKGRSLLQQRWFVMGQVCVAEAYRGMGVFDGMYQKLAEHCRADFDLVITEVAERNARSLRAHTRVGFQTIHQYSDATAGEQWHIIALPLH